MTKVLLFVKNLSNGGTQRVVTLWASFLYDSGYDVTVLTLYPNADEYPLNPAIKRDNLFASAAAWEKLDDPVTDGANLLAQYLAAYPQDILIPFLYLPNLISAACVTSNVKVIAQTLRNSPWSQEIGFNRHSRDAAIQKQGLIILQNSEQLSYFETPRFAKVKKYVVHNPLNPAILKLQKTDYRPIKKILAISRLVPHKNIPMMLDTIQILQNQYHFNGTLDIYGTGPELENLQHYCKALGIQDRVHFCGYTPQIFDLALQYDLFLMTSRHEGMPNALLETMGLGLPVITTNFRTGARELIRNGVNGYLLDDDDPAKLAALIMQINNPTTLRALGTQARNDMQRYAPANCIAELTACLQDLLKSQESL